MTPDSSPRDENATERARFEAWMKRADIDAAHWLPGSPQDGFRNARVQDYWTGWLERSRETVAPVLPTLRTTPGENPFNDAMRDAMVGLNDEIAKALDDHIASVKRRWPVTAPGRNDPHADKRARFEEWGSRFGFDLTFRDPKRVMLGYRDGRTRDRWQGWLFSHSNPAPTPKPPTGGAPAFLRALADLLEQHKATLGSPRLDQDVEIRVAGVEVATLWCLGRDRGAQRLRLVADELDPPVTINAMWGSLDEHGRWQPNPALSMTADEQRNDNRARGWPCP